ncbi:MAG: tRNA (adenosine(37)-N6)-dimethylallyltransferase MiaA [Halanaerobiales bacterium]
MERYPLVVILGPTAAGKTELSLKIAEEINGEIISADSMQIYRMMDIGTAKASKEEQQRIKHHLIDIVNPDQEFSVADYQEKVDKLIPEIIARGSLPILVGGTGLYIKAIIEGFLFPEMNTNMELRKQLEKEASKHGNEYVHDKLRKIDKELAEKLHPNDLRRVIRGIEVYHETGHTVTYYKEKQAETPARYNALKIGLTRERDILYQRINQRVDKMIEEGLIKEVNSLLESGYDIGTTALQGLGYKEILRYLDNEYSLDEAVRILKRDTRHFAKRQLTWFRRDNSIHWFDLSEMDQSTVFKEITSLINKWSSKYNFNIDI